MGDLSPLPQRSADLRSRFIAAACGVRVLVVGALNVDTLLHTEVFPEPDSAVVVREMHRCPGGHAGNTSAGLAALGATVRILAAVGMDADGHLLVDDLAKIGVDTSRIRRVPHAPTGQVFIPSTRGKHYMLLARGANDALRVRLGQEITDFEPTAVVLFDPPREILLQVAALRTEGHRLSGIYWCPGPINCHAADLAAAVMPHVDVLLVNEVERLGLASALNAAVAVELVTTHGARGAEVEVGQERTSADACSVKVIDTVGSGDAFLAAYVVAREAALLMEERLAIANAYGALAARAAGARAGLATASDLMRFVGESAEGLDGSTERQGKFNVGADA